ncbi:MAG: undecaprenyl-diphosphate phosphatase [Chloroflexi bacterium]|nr:undecaprenyl-diphosphate phosphatase [Chloroflexota bacterium]
MNIVQVATLAFMQGFTELLPISSSGYMIIASWVLGWDPPSAAFDATVHLGSLLALALFFRRDWMLILRTFQRGRTIPLGGDDDLMSMQTLEKHRRIGDMRRRLSIPMSMPSKNLLKAVGLGSLPAIAIGAATYQAITSDAFRSPEVAAGMFIVTGGALLLGHHFTNLRLTGKDRRTRSKVIDYTDALIIGFAQAAALIPGISRSAATITAGLTRGMPLVVAVRFSFLLSVPVIAIASIASFIQVLASSSESLPEWDELAVGFAISFVASYIAINLFMWLIRRMGTLTLWPFAMFTAATGAIVLVVVYGG